MSRCALLLTPLRAELHPLAAALQLEQHQAQAYRGSCEGWHVEARVLGPGRIGLRERLRACYEATKPEHVYLCGYAGALDPALAGGAALRFAQLGHETQRVTLDEAEPDGPMLLTSDVLIHDPAQKALLHAQTGAAAVDMEAWHVAQALAGDAVALTVIRAVSDTASMALPDDMMQWIDDAGRTRMWPVLRSLLRRPGCIGTLMALGRHTRVGAANMARVLRADLQQRR